MRSALGTSDALAAALSGVAGFFAAFVLAGVSSCALPLSKGQLTLAVLLSVLVPFLAAMGDRVGQRAFNRWVLPALVFSGPLIFPLGMGVIDGYWQKSLAAVACCAIAFATAFLSDLLSGYGNRG